MVGAPAKQEAVRYAITKHNLSIQRNCRLFELERSSYYYSPHPVDDSEERLSPATTTLGISTDNGNFGTRRNENESQKSRTIINWLGIVLPLIWGRIGLFLGFQKNS